jgi:hypothetical protein
VVDTGHSLASALDLIDKLAGTEFSGATVRVAPQQPAIVTADGESCLRYYTNYWSSNRRSSSVDIPVDFLYNVYASYADMYFGSLLNAADDLLCLKDNKVMPAIHDAGRIKTGSFDTAPRRTSKSRC